MNRQHLNLPFAPQYIARSISTWNYLPDFAVGPHSGHESLLIFYNHEPSSTLQTIRLIIIS